LDQVVKDLLKKLRPTESPLIVARDFLLNKGIQPPVITDEWWLDIIEVKESEFLYPDLNREWRWIFPLPFPYGRHGAERGLNIAWTALQLEWAEDGSNRNICQLTRPEKVHDFLRQWPGLLECAHENPATLALYAPQLTIHGFDSGFEDAFDELMKPENTSICDSLRYGNPDTVDDNEPLCGDFIAWRHPLYGNYTPSELSYEFVNAHNGSYSRKLFNGFQCLIWLLSENSQWMPKALKDTLIRGFYDRMHWWIIDLLEHENDQTLLDAIFKEEGIDFKYTKPIQDSLFDKIDSVIQELDIDDRARTLTDCFIEYGFIEAYHEETEKVREMRKR
jgi:hypothetical protein